MTLGGFVHLGLERVSAALRNEQLMGTLESLLTTPTSSQTIQVGSVLFDLIFIPLRMGLLLLMLALVFGLGLDIGGVPQALVLLVFFMPFVWGLGILAAAITLTFRRGAGIVGLATGALTLISGLYFPLALLPNWLETISAGEPAHDRGDRLARCAAGRHGLGLDRRRHPDPHAALDPVDSRRHASRSSSRSPASGVSAHWGRIDHRLRTGLRHRAE